MASVILYRQLFSKHAQRRELNCSMDAQYFATRTYTLLMLYYEIGYVIELLNILIYMLGVYKIIFLKHLCTFYVVQYVHRV